MVADKYIYGKHFTPERLIRMQFQIDIQLSVPDPISALIVNTLINGRVRFGHAL